MSDDLSKFDPNKMTPGLRNRLEEANEEFAHRKVELERAASDITPVPQDSYLPAGQKDKPAADNAHFSEKLYFFPESFNALRRELEDNYPHFFTSVNPEMGMSPAYAMVFDAPKFVGMCNGALDMDLPFDSQNVDGICKKFLNGFRAMRGVSPLSF